MIRGIKDVVDAELEGRVRQYMWRKNPSQPTNTGQWFDISMSPGNPVPKYWFDAAPLVAKAVYQSTDGGIYHGPNVSPMTKYLRLITSQLNSTNTVNVSPCNALLCDYLLYYPSIDDGTTDPQVMDNTVTLPRYTDGAGVMMVPITVGARTGGQSFFVTYTNQDGVTGRVTPNITQNTSVAVGSVTGSNSAILNATNPFIPLQDGDTGVRAVESVTMNGADSGLFSILLVKPLQQTCFRESNITTAGTVATPNEQDFLIPTGSLNIIYDDAFLNFLILPSTNVATTGFIGNTKVIWT